MLRRLFVDERQSHFVNLQTSRLRANEERRIDSRFPQRQCARDAFDVN